MRILAIDPGIKHIGLAISDPSGTIANPLMVLEHQSKETDIESIILQVALNSVELIILGQSIDDNGIPTFEGRRSARLAEMLRRKVSVPVVLWNEGFSTQDARMARIKMGVSKKRRTGHMDAMAASVILQSYLDSIFSEKE
jgi:putative Holliday junction resolvase